MENPESVTGTYDEPHVIQPGSDAHVHLKDPSHKGPLGSFNTRNGQPVPKTYNDLFADLRPAQPARSEMLAALLAQVDAKA